MELARKRPAVVRSQENRFEQTALRGILTKLLRGLAPRPTQYLAGPWKERDAVDRLIALHSLDYNRWR